MTRFFGFAVSDSMFNSSCTITRTKLSSEQACAMVASSVPCVNPSHKATLDALRDRFGVEVEVPSTPPRVNLGVGDSLLVMQVRGLPRLTDRHEYTSDEIASATFTFSLWEVLVILLQQRLFSRGLKEKKP